MADYDQRQADWAKREESRNVKVGDARGRASGDIKKGDDVRIRIDRVEALSFPSSADIKKGDTIRIIIEKV